MNIQQTPIIFTADPYALGAAIKILAAGGDSLDDKARQRITGLSRYLWQTRRDEINAIMAELEAAEDPQRV